MSATPDLTTPSGPLKMRRDGPRGWRLTDAATGLDVGGIRYDHAGDGNHYRPWLLVGPDRHEFGEPLPQLAIAARAVAAELARVRTAPA
jgi:hypothetical protein